jgi:hypothetical protein
LKEHHYWQVREAALRALTMLVERGIVTDRNWLLKETSRFILTTTNFRSYFDIKETYRTLYALCKGDEEHKGQGQGF